MRIRRSNTKNSGLRYILYTLIKLARKFKRLMRSLRPAAYVAIACCVAGIVLLVALLGKSPAGEKKAAGANRAALPEALSSSEDDTALIDFSALTPTPALTPAAEEIAPTPTIDPSLYQGVEDSERVTELQTRLMSLGYLDIDEPTQHFGPATKYAVQLFQRQHGLEQDGWAGPLTLDMIYSDNAKKYTLLEGTSGTDVDNFQRQLKDLGYLSKVTGYYGTETIDAVKAFQKENGLSVDGKAGEKTFDLINSDKAKESPALARQERRKANINKMIETAKKQVGKKYVLGNTGPNSFDCSGLVYYCLKQAGSNRRRLNAAGYSGVSDWEKITSYSKLQKGDLLFFYNDARTKVGHVGIYIGGGMMVDASSGNGKVMRRSATTKYWKEHFVVARRPW